jgi:hypothetical protein
VTLDTINWPPVVFTISRKGVEKGIMTLKVCPHLPTPEANWHLDRVHNLALCAACFEEWMKTRPASVK